jgi:hypothetical protein
MFSYSGRTPGLSSVMPGAGGCPVANPRRPAKKRRTPGAYSSTELAGIDGLEVACSTDSLVRFPPARSCVLLRARALIDALCVFDIF